jgi:hypothetical protein
MGRPAQAGSGPHASGRAEIALQPAEFAIGDHRGGDHIRQASLPRDNTLSVVQVVGGGRALPIKDDIGSVRSSDNNQRQTLVEHWDGAGWSVGSSPNTGVESTELRGVAGGGPDDVWAVSSYLNGGMDQTLTAHYAGQFSEVHPSDYFYIPVQALVRRGVISGYEDCTFRPSADTIRGQLSKIIVLSAG